MEPEIKKEHKYLPFLLTVLVTLLVVGLVVFGVVYYFYQKNLTQNTNTDVTKTESQMNDSVKKSIPTLFKTVTINNVTVPYLEDWGQPTKQITTENIVDSIEVSFKGENAIFENANKGISPSITVNNGTSYAKSNFTNKILTALKETFDNKKVSSEAIYSNNGVIPPANAGASFYSIRYVENQDSSWRGYWFVGTMGQDINARPIFFAALYNKDSDKVASIHYNIETTMSRSLENKISAAYNSGGTIMEQQQITNEIEMYTKGLYSNDSEVKNSIDSIGLVICKYL